MGYFFSTERFNVLKNEGSRAKFPYNPLGYYRDRPDRALFREIMAIHDRETTSKD